MAWILRRRGAVCLALAYLVAVAESSTWGGQAPGAAGMVRRALEEIALGRGDLAPLVVTYDDPHGLWGGLRLTISGTGQVEQTAVREQAGEPHQVSRDDLVQLAALLVQHAAWEQCVPERLAVPDEGQTSLTISYGQTSVTIWEWTNDLEHNRRISEIGDFMKKIAWKKPVSGVTAPSLPPEIHAFTARGITAHFGGEKPPGDTPLEFGVSALWFTFEGDQTPYVFRPTGELYFSDWRFDLISPDGAHVLLLQDHYGPYHVVATNKLKDYLLGRAKPDHNATKSTKPGETALVHSEGHWISPTEMQFTVACCGTSEAITYRLP